MVETIGNPLTWGARSAFGMGGHMAAVADAIGGTDRRAVPTVHELSMADVKGALRKGIEDFALFRTDVVFLCLFYPVIAASLAWLTFNHALLPILFPAIAGMALIGPLAAVGLYEMSRKHERGEETGWADAFAVLRSPGFGAVFALGMVLVVLFFTWLLAADGIYVAIFGDTAPASVGAFAHEVFATPLGWTMATIGTALGFVFAAAVLATSVVSFPLLLDRQIGVPKAIVTSVEVARKNPAVVAAWGAIVAGGLVIGSLPMMLGLIVVIPVLGHATWHLYRAAVSFN